MAKVDRVKVQSSYRPTGFADLSKFAKDRGLGGGAGERQQIFLLRRAVRVDDNGEPILMGVAVLEKSANFG